MKILAIDVSVRGCAAAFWDSQTETGHTLFEDTDRGQAERLIPMIEELMSEAECPLSSLEAIAVTRGPGSFTGVRIGLATARTLAMALNIPVLGFSTLDLISMKGSDQQDLLVIIDTKRGDYYGQIYGSSKREARIYSKEEVESWSGQVMCDEVPDVLLLAKQAASLKKDQWPQYPATPLYLRDAETSKPKNPFPAMIVETHT
ncbi:MAG: tRNA (adenosine(37)-N6)-threonylcarbamoyltransferase complex dimerization subunit type 1 TsaB [Alphaproteobacteria bacterium CG1_02_46_17]|nr:MAG: tRNA (adenosine(37)-N6)-threonylcarbamoyltransferase complex dimerization subunit type 1 TsaB [Alphaproteobacteria bacterium CG1_02_46_17]